MDKIANEIKFPAFSLVIEWENAKLSEFDRSRSMLTRLAGQITEIHSTLEQSPELIIVYDSLEIDPNVIRDMLSETFPDPTIVDTRLIPTNGKTYYQQKNVGASNSSNEIVVYLDSDVIPEPEWLKGLLEALRSPSIEVVGGNTYVDLDSLTARAFALFWFFPLRKTGNGLHPVENFFANNVAFRRELIVNTPFPDLPATRGACVVLAQELRGKGHQIYISENSRVSHPPPNGYIHLAKRAICQGHDDLVLGNIREPHPYKDPLRNALARFSRRLRRAVKRIRKSRYRKAVGITPLGAVYATLLGINYYLFYLLGLGMSLVNPDYVFRRFSV